MAQRIPRGYDVNRTPYQEISEGVRPQASTVPMEAWTGLPPVRVDELAHDPIVLDAGTVVGIASGGLANGKLFPATAFGGTGNVFLRHHSDGSSWGLPIVDNIATLNVIAGGPVKPLGVVFQPIYGFTLNTAFTNYKRNENVGVVTDYLIQVPARTTEERAIRAGDMVMVSTTAQEYGHGLAAGTAPMGTLEAWDGLASTINFCIGRCFQNIVFATGSNSVVLSDDFPATSLTAAGQAEFKGLERVQTVPGLTVSGSGTKGVPGWLTKAQSDGSGNYRGLTILVRL
jgi:hypothetical protein